jgi:hypothetical protein
MDYWPAANSLLVASRDEIRTISFPLLRSGPLFRIPGENYAVATLDRSRVLVGQSTELLLVDLADPQDREGLPVRERIPIPSPVLALAVSTDGSRAVARLADDGVHPVGFDPLRLESPAPGPAPIAAAPETESPVLSEPAEPPASSLAQDEMETPARETAPAAVLGGPAEAEAVAPIETPPSAPRAVQGEADELVSPPAEPDPVTPAPVHAATPPITEDAPSVQPPEQPSPLPADEPRVAPSTPAVEIVASEPTTELTAQIRGRIDGPAAAAVVAVVFLGPDNLMHEAIRVRPDADGRYRVSGLAPGRYGVQLDGGGGRSLVARPPTRTVVVDTESEIVADFHVLRVL